VSVTFEVRCASAPVLAFSRASYADTRVYIIRVGGTGLIDAGEGDAPSWAPDGTKFVMSRMSCGFYYCGYSLGLQVTGADGAPITGLTDQADFTPDWSPDGLKIAFTRSVGPRSDLYVMNANGTAVAPLPIPGFAGGAYEPDWSPDGRHIIFACEFPTRRDICIVSADGSSFRRLTDDAAYDWSPSWSPDGTTIAFATSRFSVAFNLIALMDADGANIRAVTEGTEPSWDPEGTRLVFAARSPAPGIYSIGKDGSDRTQITTDWGDRSPAWRP
jgi:TolB protein